MKGKGRNPKNFSSKLVPTHLQYDSMVLVVLIGHEMFALISWHSEVGPDLRLSDLKRPNVQKFPMIPSISPTVSFWNASRKPTDVRMLR